MKLTKLINDIEVKKLLNFKNVNVTNLGFDSREMEKGGLFFAIKGNKFNGEDFVAEAIDKGCSAVVVEREMKVCVPQIIVDNVRKTMALVAKNFYGKSDEKLKIIELIGTNGKTTTATIIYNILKDSGKKVGLIGTNGVMIGEFSFPNFLTTPDPIDLHYIFNQMVMFGVEYCVMEVSAQSIYYDKVSGIDPDIVVYTNITPEHLDFFGDMENYANTKINYILNNKNAKVIVNSDDEYGQKMLKQREMISYGIFNPAEVFAIDINMTLRKCGFVCNAFDDVFDVVSGFVGDYNVYNVLASIAVAKILNIDTRIIQNTLKNLKKVDGRWEVFDFDNNNKVIVDYAHTPDGFNKVLSLVKSLRKGRIITLFGCVGYSNAEKRKQMGDIVKKYSDFAIITSDNLSDRDFNKMFREIGIDKFYAKIEDRKHAVDFAMSLLDKNDTLLLLGKGAETIQKTTDGDVEYSEIKLIQEYQKRNNVG